MVRVMLGLTAAFAAASMLAAPAFAAAKKKHAAPPMVVARSAAGTIIQPTTTIIHDGQGHTTVIVIPRRRSYLDIGTEVSVGEGHTMDYMLPPGGDPGRPNWFHGPDVQGSGGMPLPTPFYLPGITQIRRSNHDRAAMRPPRPGMSANGAA